MAEREAGPRTYTIEVTAEDIANGIPMEPCKCPISLAATRSIGYPCAVAVDYIRKRYGDDHAALPKEAADFVLRFDSGRPVAPFQFEVTL